jgi:DNA-binding beta-propeller fold protein YncE
MHIGNAHPNYAYVSGWEDNKVYVVNLDTLTIAQTINLPTTGYTTAAVDDVNQIAYIFQRDSYPSTEDHYNLIAYDYAKDEILSTRVLERPFAAMQGCDYLEGKIIVLNGLGTAVGPNYYLVYNTSGDIIQELVLGAFATQEPEGVFVDRKTKDIYMNMYASKKLYRIK